MKYYISFIVLFLASVNTFAQVGVETQSVRGDGIMDFKYPQTSGETKGILLPKLTNTSSADTPTDGGAVAFNTTSKMVEYYSNEDNTWKPLTPAHNVVVQSDIVRSGFSEIADNGNIVETANIPAERAKGVLVLDSTDHALILPTVATSTDLPSVSANSAGMMCYIEDIKTMAVYNGETWSFWN